MQPLPPVEAMAAEFVRVLRSWANLSFKAISTRHGPDFWQDMLDANAAETDPHICHSHDWCDANEAMAKAFDNLGVDRTARWGDDWASNDEASAYWGAAWQAAMPALGRKS